MNSCLWLLWRLFAVNNAVSAAQEMEPPQRLKQLLEEAKKNPDIKQYPWFYMAFEAPNSNPHFFDLLLYPTDGPFYRERSAQYDKIKIPTYCGAHWGSYVYWHLPGAFRDYLGIEAPKKLLIVPNFLDRPWHQIHDIVIRWFDHWLKGLDTGIMDEPPITIGVRGANVWHYEHEWPLERTKWTKFYLRSWGRLSEEPEAFYSEPDCFVQMPPTMTSSIQSLKYVTSAFPEDVELTGPAALYLHAAIDQEDTNWIITLKDVDESGAETEWTRGWLKASHRAIDEGKSKPWQPYHPHVEPESIKPGEVYEYPIEIRPTSTVFRRGHRIMLEIASMDLPTYYRGMSILPPYHVCSSKTTLHKIYRDEIHPSHLLLPIIPK